MFHIYTISNQGLVSYIHHLKPRCFIYIPSQTKVFHIYTISNQGLVSYIHHLKPRCYTLALKWMHPSPPPLHIGIKMDAPTFDTTVSFRLVVCVGFFFGFSIFNLFIFWRRGGGGVYVYFRVYTLILQSCRSALVQLCTYHKIF